MNELAKRRIDVTIKGYRQVGKTALAEVIRLALVEKGITCVQIHSDPKTLSTPAAELAHAMEKGYRPDLLSVHINDLDDYQVAEFLEGSLVKFNPYTGVPRDERDIAFDPRGLLIISPEVWRRALISGPTCNHSRTMMFSNSLRFGIDSTE